MRSHHLVASLLWLTSAALPAQYFESVETETRRTTRVTWLGLSGAQTVDLDYGQPVWRPEHERFLRENAPTPVLLGNGASTTLRTDVDLAFGAQKLARGRWYVSARVGGDGEWSLQLFAADRVDASGRGASALLATEPDLRVPMRVTRADELADRFDATLTTAEPSSHELLLAMAWGPYRSRVAFAAAFDERRPAGAPEFALTAEGKGTKTASGLVYEQLRAGSGAHPRPGDVLRLHYAAWLTDGTLFDSSYLRGEPASLTSEMVMKGFAEALPLMQPGATFRLTIPPELAYGSQRVGRVPPHATLVFTVTLLGFAER